MAADSKYVRIVFNVRYEQQANNMMRSKAQAKDQNSNDI